MTSAIGQCETLAYAHNGMQPDTFPQSRARCRRRTSRVTTSPLTDHELLSDRPSLDWPLHSAAGRAERYTSPTRPPCSISCATTSSSTISTSALTLACTIGESPHPRICHSIPTSSSPPIASTLSLHSLSCSAPCSTSSVRRQYAISASKSGGAQTCILSELRKKPLSCARSSKIRIVRFTVGTISFCASVAAGVLFWFTYFVGTRLGESQQRHDGPCA